MCIRDSGIAQENSGKLVHLVRQKAKETAVREGLDLTINDGPPGIGCAVISSLSGASLACIVTEPSVSGIHDMERVLQVCRHFGVPALVCVNKHDINEDGTRQVEDYCDQVGVGVVAKIPFDTRVTEAQVQGVSIVLLFFIIILAVIKAYDQIAHHKISTRTWIMLSVLIFLGGVLHLWNTWPEILFNLKASEPVQGQIFRSVAFGLIQMLILATCFPLLVLLTRDKDSDHLRDKPSVWIGLAAGFIGLGLLTLIGRSLTSYQPTWAYYEPLNSRYPLLFLFITRVWIFSMVTVILLYLFRGMDHYSGGFVRKKGKVMLILALTGLASAALFMMDTFSIWLSMGAILSVWIIWLFRVVYRAMPSTIPFAVLPFFLSESFKQIRYEGYEGVISAEIVAMTGMILVAVLFWYLLGIDRKTI